MKIKGRRWLSRSRTRKEEQEEDVLDLALPANPWNPEDIEDIGRGKSMFLACCRLRWSLGRCIITCRTYSGCFLTQWWAGKKRRRIGGSIFSDIMSNHMTSTPSGGRECPLYTGLEAGFGRGDGQTLKCLLFNILFFFLCINLIFFLLSNTIFMHLILSVS